MRRSTYVRYELIRSFRNRRFYLFTVGFPLVLYLLIGAPNRDAGKTLRLRRTVGGDLLRGLRSQLREELRELPDRGKIRRRELDVLPLGRADLRDLLRAAEAVVLRARPPSHLVRAGPFVRDA